MAHQGLPRAASHGVVCPQARVHRPQRAVAPPCSQDPREPPAPPSHVYRSAHSSRSETFPVNLTPALGWGVEVPSLNVRVDQEKDSVAHLPEHGHARPVNVLLLQHRPAERRGGGLVTAWWRRHRRAQGVPLAIARLAVCACATSRGLARPLEGVRVPELAGALSAEPPGPGLQAPGVPALLCHLHSDHRTPNHPNAGRGSWVTRVKGAPALCAGLGSGSWALRT